MYQQIKAVRKYTGKTQKDFGETLGVSRDVYANIENARVEPSKTFIQLLCSTYSINHEWLATGRGDMFVQDNNVLLSQLAKQTILTHSAANLLKRTYHSAIPRTL